MTGVKTSPSRNVPDVFHNNSHGFVTLLFRQVGNFKFRLEYRAFFTGKATDVCGNGLQQSLILIRNVQDFLHLHQDLYHAAVCDLESENLSRVNPVKRSWYRSIQRRWRRIWYVIYGYIVLHMVNVLDRLAISRKRRVKPKELGMRVTVSWSSNYAA